MRGSLPGEMSRWHLEIVESYCRLYLIIWRRKSGKTRGTGQMEHSHCGSQEGNGPHFPQKSRCYGVEIAVFKYLSAPANPTKACSFPLPSLPAGGTVPLSWISTAPSLCSGASSVSPSKPFFILCLLHLHSLPLSGFCFSLYQVHTCVSPWKKVSQRSHI